MKIRNIINDQQFRNFICDVKYQWEVFDKNVMVACDEFDPTFARLLNKHNIELVDDETFVSNALDVNRTQMVDDFTDGGLCLFDYISGEIFALGTNSYEHYAENLSLAVQYK